MNYQSIINKSLQAYSAKNFRQGISLLEGLLNKVSLLDYLLIGKETAVPKKVIIDTLYNLGVMYKEYAESTLSKKISSGKGSIDDNESSLIQKSIETFQKCLNVAHEHDGSTVNIVSLYSTLCHFNQSNPEVCAKFLQESLFHDPSNPLVHYNLGFIYQKLNKLELSLIHYKLSIKLISSVAPDSRKNKLIINCYYGIACVFRSIKQWPESLYYLLKGVKYDPNDPDLNNHLGIVYTELRRTDLAEKCYERAIQHHKKAFISSNSNVLLSEIYLNLGQMHSYNGDTKSSIDCYEKSLAINPKFILPYQNRIMNLNYLFDTFDNKMYIKSQHTLVNDILDVTTNYTFNKDFYATPHNKINIGFVSGDFVDHPVSYFLNGILQNLDYNRFNVFCYSECVIDTTRFPKNIQFRIIKHKSPRDASNIVYNDKIHILIDLAGHTAMNRLDVFACKPSPIQITYIGYPNTTGLKTMDYRLTDSFCDGEQSQKYYTEKLLYMPNAFLTYTSNDRPALAEPPYKKNGFITFGCFNRINKITDSVISLWNKLLVEVPSSRILFKTKALLNKKVRESFLNKFSSNSNRIDIVDCTITHSQHLSEYNSIDIALDTFPYSGTTTSCEALLMGVPVLTYFDDKLHFHAQNVTSSLLINSNLSEYVCKSQEDFVKVAMSLENKLTQPGFKQDVRDKFLNGKVCDNKQFTNDFSNLLTDLFNKTAN